MKATLLNARIVCVLILLAACADFTLPVTAFPETFDYYVYDSGKVVEHLKINASDARHKALKKFLEENAHGWTADLNSYAPTIFFRSDDMTVACYRDGVVVNTKTASGHWYQLSKEVRGCSDVVNGSK